MNKVINIKQFLLTSIITALSFSTLAQVAIGNGALESSAALEIKSANKGLLLPRLSVEQILAINKPAEGLLLYCTNCDVKGIFIYNGVSFLGLIDGLGLNAAVNSNTVLAQIGLEAATNSSTITIAQLQAILPSLENYNKNYHSFYQTYFNNNANLFGSPATQIQVQTAIYNVNSTNVLKKIATQQIVTLAELQMLATTGRIDNKLDSYNNYITHFNSAFTDVQATLTEVTAMYTLLTTNVATSTGRIWMDRNLGAINVAVNSNDENAYGSLYQWGRSKDGHQITTSSLTPGPVAAGTEGINYITNKEANPRTGGGDWLTVNNGTRWNNNEKGAQDPCPNGFRVPTLNELELERSVLAVQGTSGAFGSPLKLVTAGLRSFRDGDINVTGISGYYWSSTSSIDDGNRANVLKLSSRSISTRTLFKASGVSVRCIKD